MYVFPTQRVFAARSCKSAMDWVCLRRVGTRTDGLMRQRFLVLPAPQIQAYQAQISSSIAPQIETLISRAEALRSSQAARQANLEERLSIVASRHQPASRMVSASAASGKAAEDGDAQAEEDEEEVDFEHNYIADIPMKDYSIPQRRKIAGLKSRRARLEKEWKAHLAETGGE